MRMIMAKQQQQNIANEIVAKSDLLVDELFSLLVDKGIFPRECGWSYGTSTADYERDVANVILYINAVPGAYAQAQIPAMLNNFIHLRAKPDGTVTYTINVEFRLQMGYFSIIELPKPRKITRRATGRVTITTRRELVDALTEEFRELYINMGGILALLSLIHTHGRDGMLYEALLLAIVGQSEEDVIRKSFTAYLERKLGKRDYKIRQSTIARHEVDSSTAHRHFETAHHAVNIELRALTENNELVATAHIKIYTALKVQFEQDYGALHIAWYIIVAPIAVRLPNNEEDYLGRNTTLSVKAITGRDIMHLRLYVVQNYGELITNAIANNFLADAE